MRLLKFIWFVAAFASATGCEIRKVPDNDDGTSGPHLANLCLAASDWPRLLSTMKSFGARRRLEMHGGVENDSSNGPMLNVYLAEGYSFYFGDDFDIWFVSDPFRKNVVSVGAVLKRKPITREQQALADGLLSELSAFTTRASGPQSNPSCP